VSLVVALAIPSGNRDGVFDGFRRLKMRFSGSTEELKGSQLTERRVSGVISLLLANDALLEARLIDTAEQTSELTSEFKVLPRFPGWVGGAGRRLGGI
jgi:hypothetical protein